MSSRLIEARPTSRASTEDLGALLRALSDETRLRIFALLTKTELCVCEIEDILDLSQSLVSNHLAVLRRAGLVESRRDAEDARWVFYRANAAGGRCVAGTAGSAARGTDGAGRPAAG